MIHGPLTVNETAEAPEPLTDEEIAEAHAAYAAISPDDEGVNRVGHSFVGRLLATIKKQEIELNMRRTIAAMNLRN